MGSETKSYQLIVEKTVYHFCVRPPWVTYGSQLQFLALYGCMCNLKQHFCLLLSCRRLALVTVNARVQGDRMENCLLHKRDKKVQSTGNTARLCVAFCSAEKKGRQKKEEKKKKGINNFHDSSHDF